jgi:hypothetical protein
VCVDGSGRSMEEEGEGYKSIDLEPSDVFCIQDLVGLAYE